MKTLEQLALEAGFNVVDGMRGPRIDSRSVLTSGGFAMAGQNYHPPEILDALTRFAELVRQQALEEAAALVEKSVQCRSCGYVDGQPWSISGKAKLANAIRALSVPLQPDQPA